MLEAAVGELVAGEHTVAIARLDCDRNRSNARRIHVGARTRTGARAGRTAGIRATRTLRVFVFQP
jgi:hypothetical protein